VNFTGFTIAAFSFAIGLTFAPTVAAASESADAVAAARHAIAAFNKGDLKAWAGACDSPASIIDDFPPHTWWGATACADWVKAFTAFGKANKITDNLVTLGKPWQAAVTGDRAYTVFPATYTYKLAGKPMTESGSAMTIVLKKTSYGWLIEAWAWAQHPYVSASRRAENGGTAPRRTRRDMRAPDDSHRPFCAFLPKGVNL
jgi:hypothetical protein